MENLKQLRELMNQYSLDGLAVVPGPNMSHLTKSRFHLSERPVVFFILQNEATFILPELESPKILDLGVDYITYDDEEGPRPAFEKFAKTNNISKLGVESRTIRHLELDLISSTGISSNIVDSIDIFAKLRMSKSDKEKDCMIDAVKIAETSLKSILGNIKPGVTEKQFAADLVIELLRNGSDSELPFSPIVASGINAANPHHFPGNKEFQDGELIIIDWGANFEGYFSDITRTFALGDSIDSELLRAYEVVKNANKSARIKADIGIQAGNVDQAARKVIEKSGFGKFFTHRTGHGLGLEVHEEPYIKPGNDFILEKGMTFTIEPGIYMPNLGGIRIEDDIYLESSGATSLTTLSRELIHL